MAQANYNDMAHKILDAAEALTQTRGFNAFSYKDIQAEVGVKTSSIHYYFPTKQELASAMAQRYVERFLEALETINREHASPLQRIRQADVIFVDVARKSRLCLCGMLTSDLLSMPDMAAEQLRFFFNESEAWLSKHIQAAAEAGEIRKDVDPNRLAAHLLATWEGGALVARMRPSDSYMEDLLETSLALLTG